MSLKNSFLKIFDIVDDSSFVFRSLLSLRFSNKAYIFLQKQLEGNKVEIAIKFNPRRF